MPLCTIMSGKYSFILRRGLRMGFFDGFTGALFKKGANDENLFFPNGIIGSGYVLKDDFHKNKIQHSMNKWFMGGLSNLL